MRNIQWKHRRMGLSFFILLAATIIYTGCSIESPQAPTWDADLTVPLITHHYDIYELIDRLAEEALSYDEGGNIMITFDQSIDTVAIDAGLTIDDIHDTYTDQLGAITINPPAPLSTSLYLQDYVAIATGNVDAFGFTAGKDFEVMSDFESAIISEGQMELTITNEFGLNVDSLTIWFINTNQSDTIFTYVSPGGLMTGETLVDTVTIDGSSVTNQLSLALRIHTPGGTLFSVSDKNLSVTAVLLDGMTVTSAVAQILSQEKDYLETVEIEEDHQLTSAQISSGQIVFDIQNTSNLSGNFTITVDELESNGQPLEVTANIPAQGNNQIYQNLAGYQMRPQINGSSMAVDVDLNIAIAGSGENLVAVDADDNYALSASVENLQFAQVSGIIAPTEIELANTVEQIDLPSGMEDISLTDAVITINLYSEVDIPAEVNVDLTGDAGQFLNIVSDIQSGSPGNPGLTQIFIDDLSSLTSPVPSEITISGIAIAGDGVTSGTVSTQSKVWGEIEISSPLKFAMGETQVDADINSTEIDQEDIEEISERLLGGTINAALTNHLPFGCEVELFFSGDSTTLYTAPQLTIGPFSVESGVISDGLVSQAAISEIVISLSESDLDIIENPTLYVGQNVYLPGTSGQVVSIISSDYLDISAYMTLTTRLGGEWD